MTSVQPSNPRERRLAGSGSDILIARLRPRDVLPYFALLVEAGLPTAGLDDHLSATLVARRPGWFVGGAALEIHGEVGFLRSVVVEQRLRGSGLGRRLVEAQLDEARIRGLRAVYLLTETAGPFFRTLGFTAIPRAEADPAIRASAEFQGVCPESATLMVRALERTD